MTEVNIDGEEIMDRRNTSVLERHFATVVTSLILIAILWVGDTVLEQGKQQIKLVGAMNLMNSEITHLKELLKVSSNDQYTRSNAEADKAKYDLLIAELNRRVSNLEETHKQRYNRGSP